MWEARTVWGGIVNASRSLAMELRDLPTSAPGVDLGVAHRTLGLRHIAWLTALRFQLRTPAAWESMRDAANMAYQSKHYAVAEWSEKVDDALRPLLSAEEHADVLRHANRPAAIMALQSQHFAALAAAGALSEMRHVTLVQRLASLIDQQGRAERIKNFPYPTQFATFNAAITRIFVFLLPLGLVRECAELGGALVWLTVPLSVLISWIFVALEKAGDVTSNPFEGSPNDVPITAISRTIEIDVRQILELGDVPTPLTATNNILL
jgi:putative membrane protein